MGRVWWFWPVLMALGLGGWLQPSAASARLPAAQMIRTCVAVDTGQSPAEMLAPDAAFDCRTPQSAFGPGDFWVRSAGLPAGTGGRLTQLRSTWQWQQRSQLFVRFADGTAVSMPVETPRSRSTDISGMVIDVVLPRRTAAIAALLWHVQGSANIRRIKGDTYAVTQQQDASHEIRTAAMLAGVTGLGLALLAYNFALWVALRRWFQLAYCGLAGSLLVYAALSAGVLAPLLPGVDRNQWIAAAYVMLAVSLAAALWFTRAFFGRNRLPAGLHRACAWLSVALIAGSAVTFVTPLSLLRSLDRAHGILCLVTLALTGPLLVQAWKQGRAFFTVLMLAWAGPAILALMRVANTFHLFSYILAVRDWTMALLAAQALFGSLAIAWRIHLVARERDEARAQEVAARLLADTDPLTGLLNRRSFLAQAIGRPGPQTLLIADLDHFKAINETLGHDGGDEVLRAFARALLATLPPGTLAARIGGEEFAVLADASADVPPRLIAEALRRVRMPFDLAVTTSVGTCTGPLAREADWKLLYRQADRALYAAKAAGRDRVRDAGALTLVA